MFKEIVIGLKHGLLMTSEVFLTLLGKFSLSLPSVHFWYCAEIFLVSHSVAIHIIIKGIAIWGVKRLKVRGDMVEEIFFQPTLGSPACGSWCKVLLSNPLSRLRSALPLLGTWCKPCIESKAMWEDKWKPSLVITQNILLRTGYLLFISRTVFVF